MYNICFVEDEKNLQNIVRSYLEKEGYQIICFENGMDALNYQGKVHLWILDIMLKDEISGYDIIKKIREQADTPVIFTSARDQDIDKIIGLELGSDDYITKPYSTKELVLRVNNMIKRTYKTTETKELIYGEYRIDEVKRTVYHEKKEIKLTTLEFDLLLFLLKNKTHTYSREAIIENVWGNDYYGSDRVVDDLIRRIRKKLPKLNINTIYGYGYRLV